MGVALSGGADSVCLFHALRQELQLPVAILHVNHQLRGAESDADEEFVRELGRRAGGVPVHVLRADTAESGGNLEEEARRIRYAFYRDCIDSGKVSCVATGHTRRDQAETVLFRVLRGAHLAGLAAIRPVVAGPIVRPLLDVTRAEVEEYLRERGQPWREDSSNRELRFDRNRLRHGLLPELERDWNPELERNLAQLAALAQDDERFWTSYIEELVAGEGILKIEGNIVLVRASKLVDDFPPAVSRRLVRRAIEAVRGDLHSIGYMHVEDILALARQAEGHGRLQVPGVDVMRSFEWLRLARREAKNEESNRLEARNEEVVCQIPGVARLEGAGVALELEVLEVIDLTGVEGSRAGVVENARVELADLCLDSDRVAALGEAVRLRTWRPGDQYRPVGEREALKVKALFQEHRIPLWERGRWPMITAGQQILWSKHFGPAAEFAAHAGTRRLLRVRMLAAAGQD